MKGFRVVLLAGMLNACASQVTYYNPNITDDTARNNQFAIDDGYCTQVTEGSVPMPEVRYYQPNQSHYSINSTTTAYNYNTGYTTYKTTGSINSYPSPADSFANGFANGASIGAAIAASNNRKKVYHGCMVSLGWTTDRNEKPKQIKDPYSNAPVEVANAIKSIPTLKGWFESNDPRFWVAAAIDKELMKQDLWKNASLEARFMEATKRVENSTN